MTDDALFQGLLINLCTIQSRSTAFNDTGYEALVFSTGTQFDCRLTPNAPRSQGDRFGRTSNLTTTKLFLNHDVAIDVTSRILSSGLTYDVVVVNKYPDELGIHHIEALIERVS